MGLGCQPASECSAIIQSPFRTPFRGRGRGRPAAAKRRAGPEAAAAVSPVGRLSRRPADSVAVDCPASEARHGDRTTPLSQPGSLSDHIFSILAGHPGQWPVLLCQGSESAARADCSPARRPGPAGPAHLPKILPAEIQTISSVLWEMRFQDSYHTQES